MMLANVLALADHRSEFRLDEIPMDLDVAVAGMPSASTPPVVAACDVVADGASIVARSTQMVQDRLR